MKKIPKNAEASNVLVGEVDFLDKPFVAFVRLIQSTMLGGMTEVPIPTRYVNHQKQSAPSSSLKNRNGTKVWRGFPIFAISFLFLCFYPGSFRVAKMVSKGMIHLLYLISLYAIPHKYWVHTCFKSLLNWLIFVENTNHSKPLLKFHPLTCQKIQLTIAFNYVPFQILLLSSKNHRHSSLFI